MSGVELDLAKMTTVFIDEYDRTSGYTVRAQLVREFVAKAKTRIYRTGGGGDGHHDILLDTEGIEEATSVDIVYPSRPGAERVVRHVKCVRMISGRILVDDTKAPPLGSVIWLGEKPYIVFGADTVWNSAATYKYFQCEVEASE
jgi:hypothetical protein